LNAKLELSDRDTRESICQTALPEVRSFVGGDDQRRRDCQRQIVTFASPASDDDSSSESTPQGQLQDFLLCVRDAFRRLADEGRPVFVEIQHGAAELDEVQALLSSLSRLPGATAVEEEIYKGGAAQVQLRFLGGSQWLAEILERDFAEIAADSGLSLRRREVTGRFVRMSVAR
jgi:hypothetical protein